MDHRQGPDKLQITHPKGTLQASGPASAFAAALGFAGADVTTDQFRRLFGFALSDLMSTGLTMFEWSFF